MREEQAGALAAVLLPLLGGEARPDEPPPRGLARYCRASTAEEAVLLADCFRAVTKRLGGWLLEALPPPLPQPPADHRTVAPPPHPGWTEQVLKPRNMLAALHFAPL